MMTSVEQLIGDLLLRHNCVIIPSFGGFVAQPVSARIDYENGTMRPPSKSLLFNRQLISNDGLLMNEYAQINQISYDEAVQEVHDKVSEWSTKLRDGGRIEIDRVGNLFHDEENNICFEQDRFFNLLLESFGLGKVHFLSGEDVQIAEHRIQVEEQSIVEPESTETTPVFKLEEKEAEPTQEPKEGVKIVPLVTQEPIQEAQREDIQEPAATMVVVERKRRPWRYVAAACFLPLAFYSFWIPVKTDVLESGVISIHDFNPFHTYSDASYVKQEFDRNLEAERSPEKTLEAQVQELPGETEVYPYKLDDDTYIKVKLPEQDIQSTDESHESIESVATAESVEDNSTQFKPQGMHFIVGCFGDKENADNLVSSLKSNGMDARIVGQVNGLYRVSAGTGISMEAMKEIRAKVEGLGHSGWVLK